MSFQIRRAVRQKAKLRIGMFGTSGSGKTYSALLLAKGLVGDWSKVCVIDSENNSADLYADLGEYNTLLLSAPYTPERYVEAIKTCIQAKMECIIVDSISHEWEGKGGALEIKEQLDLGGGNSYTNWGRITPRHNSFLEEILTAPCHVICCGRVKTDVVISQNDKGKSVPQKVGLKVITREGLDYEMTACFDIQNKSHLATVSKDRTGLFVDKPDWVITSKDGELLAQWADSGAEVIERPLTLQEFEREVMAWGKNYGLTLSNALPYFCTNGEVSLAQIPEDERRQRLRVYEVTNS
ncbi:MAG: ATP-binding protein [Vampirovibrionales bacterium]|jgi:hypothetical protein|nr:ATP-binding protein [Vampirovibrionales bacterium]